MDYKAKLVLFVAVVPLMWRDVKATAVLLTAVSVPEGEYLQRGKSKQEWRSVQ